MRLKELCRDEMPREKMIDKGAEALTDTELIAILLRVGRDGKNVVDMSRELLQSAGGSLTALAGLSIDRLCRTSGIGPGKAVSLAAAFELGRRVETERLAVSELQVASPKTVFRYMMPLMRTLDHEECWVLLLNRANRIICRVCMSSGGQYSTVIDCKAIIRKAIDKKASSVVLVHNHPSGSALPSAEDIKQTQHLNKALKSCDLSLLDHVVIASDGYYSFADEMLYKE